MVQQLAGHEINMETGPADALASHISNVMVLQINHVLSLDLKYTYKLVLHV